MKVDRFLGEVQKPARYVGGEWNEIIKQGPQIAVRMALCYPDIYEVGMSHLGSRILYEVVNRHPHAVCERAFLPWPDYAGQLRRQGLLLTSLETGTPLREFDLIGITLQHELTYPGVVKLLELAGIPIWSEERAERDPLIIGGGPCAAHPEPVAPFFDALVVGDGEEVLVEIIEVCLEHSDRAGRLSALAHLPGVYVPALYEATRGCPVPKTKAAPPKIQRRIVLDLDAAPYPLRPIVPFVEIVHDRVQLEINRGCTHGCRFCQAGILYRPVRQRSLETLRRYARELLTKTGYEQISLASLSCTDYPHIIELVDAITTDFGEQRVSISLPSLRTDQFGIELARRVSRARKSPVTLAPEAGSQRLRDVINKNVTEANLQAAVRAAFRAGWHSVK
ncbi:MAG: TIGR03960 family B12-binding radical SAM protein, partial [Candidatus Zipacnadales bacterium]